MCINYVVSYSQYLAASLWNETILRPTLFVTVSLMGVIGMKLGVALMVVVGGGSGEVKLKEGMVWMGRAMVGRSGSSAI